MFQGALAICWIILANYFLTNVDGQDLPLCRSLNELEGAGHVDHDSEVKSRRVRALCDAIQASRGKSDQDDLDAIPDFDLNLIETGKFGRWWR